jgi:hypothetical protein
LQSDEHTGQTKEKPKTSSGIAHMTGIEMQVCWYGVQRK